MANDTNKQGGVGLPPETKIGKYEIKERLAIGGQAIIYKAYDAMLDRHVAIKQISSHLAEDPKFLERFRKEAQILARLGTQQPAIVTIYELVEDQRGLFIVMEHIPGKTLETVLAENPQPMEVKAVMQILWRLAAALNDVHAAGIIHRDIKPGNIIIGEGLRPKITDFGVAASLTGQTSMLLGTTKYMAPELLGSGGFDGRADMYSLGFIIYEMLIGREKFNEIFADVVRDKHSESLRWMKWHGNMSVVAPTAHEINADIPVSVGTIVAKMIAKDQTQRFESMESLGRAIKTEFSPKAKAASAVPDASGKKHKHHHKHAAGAVAGDTNGQGKPPMSGDDGDDLEINAQGPDTAPIPKKKLSVRAKIILASAAAVLIIAVSIVFAVINARSASQLEQRAMVLYKAGDDAFGRKDYDKAVKTFKQLLQTPDFKNTDQASKALVMIPLCEGYAAIAEGNWPDAGKVAGEKQEEADNTRKRIERAAKSGSSLHKWATGEMSQEIVKFNDFRTRSIGFNDAMKLAEKAFAEEKYDDALTELNKITALPDDAAKSRLQVFRKQLELKKFMSGVDLLVNKGMELTIANKFDEADKAYAEALGRFDLPEAAGLFTADEKKKRVDGIKQKIDEMKGDRKLLLLRSKIAQALKDRDKKAEFDAITEYLKLKPGDTEQAARATLLKAMIACDEGMQAEAQKMYTKAREKYIESIQIKETPTAKAGLDRMAKMDQRDALMRTANTAFDARKFAEALKSYEEAGKLIPADNALKDKMRDCRYYIGMEEADKLVTEKKWGEAAKKYEEMRIIKSEAAPEIDERLAKLKKLSEYQTNLDAGDAALKEQRWENAIDSYNRAKASNDTPEISDKISNAKYRQHLTQGKADLDLDRNRTALGHFNIAKTNAKTPEQKKEIEALISQTEQKLRDKPE